MRLCPAVALTSRPFEKCSIHLSILFAELVIIQLSGPMAISQIAAGDSPGLISFVVGDAYVDSQPVHTANQNHPVLKWGQVVRTESGRAEMVLGPNVFLRMGEFSVVRLADTKLEEAKAEIQKGAAVLEILSVTHDEIRIRCASTVTAFRKKGVYRFDADPGMLSVFGGRAEVASALTKVAAASGRRVSLDGTLSVSKFAVKDGDALHVWAARRSFYLFTSNPEALKTQFNWAITASGWSTNKDFHVRLHSPVIAQVYAQREALEAGDQRRYQQIQDYLQSQDRKAWEISQKLAREQQQK